MAHENIKFTAPHMALIDDYFYMFDTSENILIKKVSGGTVAYTYPILDYVGSQIKSLEHDGQYFWTLQDGLSPGWDVVLKKWAIEGYFCTLKDRIEISYEGSNRYDSDAFTIEHYHTTFAATVSGGNSYVCLTDYSSDSAIVGPGTVLTLGPNFSGEYEDVTVTGTILGNKIGLNFFTDYSYESGDPINISKYIWLFNNYNGVGIDGALYKFNASNGNYLGRYDGSQYKDITACTFERITAISKFDEIYSVVYVRDTDLVYLDTSSDSSVSIYCTMVLDNLQANGSTIIDVYDLVIYDGSVYRLQLRANYYGNDYVWGTHNYQLSPIRNFVDSITLSLYPDVLPTTGLNTSDATAVVKDQYLEPIVLKTVTFTDDDSVGFMTITNRLTNDHGVAISYYQSGISVGVVTVTASVTQFD